MAVSPVDRVLDALDDDNVVPLDSYKIQRNGDGGLSVTFPASAARANDLEAGDEVEGFVYGSNGALVFIQEEEL
jgi:hypothetical protein